MKATLRTLLLAAVGAVALSACGGAQTPVAKGLAASPPRAGETFRDCSDCPQMVAIPAGSFSMGSSADEVYRRDDEGPQRPVSVPAFAAGKYEVTQSEFRRFVDATDRAMGGSCFADVGGWDQTQGANWLYPGFSQTGAQPVVCVSWDDASAYAAWLSQQTAKTYRLLSEAEWEFAARSGQPSPYSFGSDAAAGCRYMNGADVTYFLGKSDRIIGTCNDGYQYTAPVGAFAPNAFGLFDMHGNVSEWVEDCYEDSYAAGQPSDGRAFTKASCLFRVARSGSWIMIPEILRSAVRDSGMQADRFSLRGFRIARTL